MKMDIIVRQAPKQVTWTSKGLFYSFLLRNPLFMPKFV